MEFPRQEYWNRLPLPTPGDLPDPGIKTASLASLALAGRFFTTVPPVGPKCDYRMILRRTKEVEQTPGDSER